MHEARNIDFKEFALAAGEELRPVVYPRLGNISAGHLYTFVPRPPKLEPPEFVYVPGPYRQSLGDNYSTKALLTITKWNALWEAGQLRPEFLPNDKDFPNELIWVKKYKGSNLYLIPDGQNAKYDAYVPLYHLLPYSKLLGHKLPAFKAGLWPPWAAPRPELSSFITHDFSTRLSTAFASYIWPLIDSGSRINAFSKEYPIRLLAHNLNFWLPYATLALEKRLKVFGLVPFENSEQRKRLQTLKEKMPKGIYAGRPRRGGTIWAGEQEAWEVAKEIVEFADRQGKLRAIVDAVRSNHIEDDFSREWSYAKEDFERKIYHKRAKIKVTFVELRETIPVHGATSEVHENLLWEDFLALLSGKERHIVICLRNGITKVGDIAKSLGYANHSPISKALSKVRMKARAYLDL
jgi:hypothetical protein